HRRLDFQSAIRCQSRVAVALKQGKASEVVRLSLNLIGNCGVERLFAVLEDAESFAMGRKIVVCGFVKLEKILLRLADCLIDVDQLFVAVVEAEYLRQGRFDGKRS